MRKKIDPAFIHVHHDLHLEEISDYDLDIIRDQAIKTLIETPENDNLKASIDAFMGYLTSKNFRIIRVIK